jgi:hypothetical protein
MLPIAGSGEVEIKMQCRATAVHRKTLIAEATVELSLPADIASLYRTREAILTKFYHTNAGIMSLRDGYLKLEYYFDSEPTH